MRFNGRDLLSIHPDVSISKEIPPGMPRRDVRTIASPMGEIVAGVDVTQDEYLVRVNIAGKSRLAAWKARAALAEWAMSSGEDTAILEPTHWPGVGYDAIVKSIDQPEFKFGFGVVEVSFLLPRPIAHDLIVTTASGSGSATMQVGGSSHARPTIRQTIKTERDGVTYSVDGKDCLKLKGKLSAGDVVEIDTILRSVTVNGSHAESRIDYSGSDWKTSLWPGKHTLSASDGGSLEARWYNEWA